MVMHIDTQAWTLSVSICVCITLAGMHLVSPHFRAPTDTPALMSPMGFGPTNKAHSSHQQPIPADLFMRDYCSLKVNASSHFSATWASFARWHSSLQSLWLFSLQLLTHRCLLAPRLGKLQALGLTTRTRTDHSVHKDWDAAQSGNAQTFSPVCGWSACTS